MALACGVRTYATIDLNSSSICALTSDPFSLASAFCSDPRWSMAAAAITPRPSDTAFIPASFPGVSFILVLLTIFHRRHIRRRGIVFQTHLRSFEICQNRNLDAQGQQETTHCTKLWFGDFRFPLAR